jgi:LysR family transcriptional regulator, transcriptional activator for bauABCD operon
LIAGAAAIARLSQIYDVDLKLLRCFCVIVEKGGFSAAQAALNLSQSVLSEHLKCLEMRLGARLCQRGPKGFKLYHEGEVVYQAARELFASVEVFKQRASTIHEKAYSELNICIQDGVADNPKSRISQALERFAVYYPNVRFNVEIMLGFQMIGRVADGSIHVGIGLFDDQFRQLSFERLFDERASLCCGRAHPLFDQLDAAITPEQIKQAAYCNRGHLDRIRYLNTSGDIGHGAHARLLLILSGRNIGYVPDHVARPYIEAGDLREIRPDAIVQINPINAVTRPSGAEFKLARHFVDSLIEMHRMTANLSGGAFGLDQQPGVKPKALAARLVGRFGVA